jgi:hypothetical protein
MLTTLSLSAFYDGSGQARDPYCRLITLGGIVAPQEVLDGVSDQWIDVLRQHKAPLSSLGSPYFHCREAMGGSGGYAGWDTRRTARLMADLLRTTTGRPELVAISCSIWLDDHRKTKAEVPALRRPEAICLDWCVGKAVRHPSRDSGIEVYFDDGEKFFGLIHTVWKPKRKPGAVWWARFVTTIAETTMYEKPGVQIADLLAWLANRYHTRGPSDSWGGRFIEAFLSGAHYHALVDRQTLLALFDSQGNMREGIELPATRIQFPPGSLLQVLAPE